MVTTAKPRHVEAFSFEHPDLDEPVELRTGVVRYPEDGTTGDQLLEVVSRTLSPA